MADIEKIADIRDEIEGQQLGMILETRGLPHHIRSYHDSAYDGLFQFQLGWGHVEAPAEYRDQIEKVLASIRADRSEIPRDGGPFRN